MGGERWLHRPTVQYHDNPCALHALHARHGDDDSAQDIEYTYADEHVGRLS